MIHLDGPSSLEACRFPGRRRRIRLAVGLRLALPRLTLLLLTLLLWIVPGRAWAQQAQTIVFSQPPPQQAYAGTSVALAATATSGLPVSFSVSSGPARVDGPNGSTLTYTGVGTVIVQADQPGGSGYSAAAAAQAPAVAVQVLTEPVGMLSAALTTVITFTGNGTLAQIAAVTQGAVNLDFNLAQATSPAGSACSLGAAYTAGQTCLATFSFRPTRPGIRYGGITLSDASGNLLANSYIYAYGVGPQVVYAPIVQTLVGNSLGRPTGVAINGNGDLFVSNATGSGLSEIAANGTVTQIGNFASGKDVAVDGSGNVFLITYDTLYEVTAVNGSISASPVIRSLTTGLTVDGGGLAIDGSGNAYIANGPGASTTTKPLGVVYVVSTVGGIIPSGSSKQTIGPLFAQPTGVAVDSAGNVFVSDGSAPGASPTPGILEMLAVNGRVPASPVVQSIGSGFVAPSNIRLDNTNDIFISDSLLPGILEFPAVNGVVSPKALPKSLGSGFIHPQGLLVDGGGNVYVADDGYSQVVKLNYSSVPTLTFAPTLVGQTSADSPQAVTYTNAGNADLVFTVPASGSNPAITRDFLLDARSTCPQLVPGGSGPGGLTATLPIGQSCTDQVSFMPSVAGPDAGTLTTVDNDLSVPSATQRVPLNGLGTLKTPALQFHIDDRFVDDPAFLVAAGTDSPGLLTYTLQSGPATLKGTTVTLAGTPGTVTVVVTQAASGIYAAAAQTASFSVAKHSQVIDFAQPRSPVSLTSLSLQVTASASSGLPVSFSVLSGPATVRGNTVTFLGAGIIVLAADQAGNAIFAAAAQVTRIVVVSSVTVALSALPNPVFLSNPISLSATLNATGGVPTGSVTFFEAGQPLAIAPLNGQGASVSLSTLAVGPHGVTAVYSGDNNFSAAQSPIQVVVVEDLVLTIANPDVTIVHGGTATYSLKLSPVGGAGTAEPVSFSVTGIPDRSIVTITPQSVPAGSAPTPATLTVATPNYPVGPFNAALTSLRLPVAALGLGLLVLPFRRRELKLSARVKPWYWTMGILMLLLSSSLLMACGSGWKTQKYALTITATSGLLQRHVAASLTTVCRNGQSACSIE